MLQLSTLLAHDAVVLQCHDNPDADTIASAFVLSLYFQAHHIPTLIVYGGYNRLSKPNLLGFVSGLSIPMQFIGKDVTHVDTLLSGAKNPLLITVDCQYGAGNVSKLECGQVLVIDHHIQETDYAQLQVIEPYLGSCATVVWRLLRAAGYDFESNRDVGTALYYGLYTDTNSLSEIFHPIDRDMLDALQFDTRLIRKLKSNNLTKVELGVASKALSGAIYDDERRTVLFEAEPCDPNILGFINDLALQVEGVEVCVGFSCINGGVKLSIRSACYGVMAHELAARLTDGVGSGGGNKEKAGGFFRLAQGAPAREFLSERLKAYFASCDEVVAGQYHPARSELRRYRKKRLMVGYVVLEDLFRAGTDVLVRTIEGDAAFTVSADTYLMVGIQGETYPIHKEKFERSYQPQEGGFSFRQEFISETFYAPTIQEKLYQRSVDLLPFIRPCLPAGESFIYVKQVARNTKVFTQWYTEGYMFGKAGDYLAIRADDLDDVYLIDARIFALTYEPAEE